MCENCIHNGVCKYEDDYKKLKNKVNEIKLNDSDGIIGIKDIPFIDRIEIRCNCFKARKYVSFRDIANQLSNEKSEEGLE